MAIKDAILKIATQPTLLEKHNPAKLPDHDSRKHSTQDILRTRLHELVAAKTCFHELRINP